MIPALLLGLMGSLHCASMCGPLVLMTPMVGATRASFLASRLLYHTGRIAIYALLGLAFGIIGESMIFAGFQRWLSIFVGGAMILGLIFAIPGTARLWRMPVALKSRFAHFFQQRTYASTFAMGAVNGLLPCGLVYMAATASIAAGSLAGSILQMIAFGLGTLPILLAISFAGQRFNFARFRPVQKLAPLAVAIVAILLVLRGEPLSLHQQETQKINCSACKE